MSETNGNGRVRDPQVIVRLPARLADRLDDAAKAVGLTKTGLIRLILSEQIRVYEERAGTSKPREVQP